MSRRMVLDLLSSGLVHPLLAPVKPRDGSSRHRLKGNPQRGRCLGREVQSFEANDLSSLILDQDDLIAGFLTDNLIVWIAKPDGESVTDPVIEYAYLSHTRTPSLMASVR